MQCSYTAGGETDKAHAAQRSLLLMDIELLLSDGKLYPALQMSNFVAGRAADDRTAC